MKTIEENDKETISGKEGLLSLPGFPIIIGCIGKNLITIAAISMVSFYDPPMLMIGIVPERYSYGLIKEIQDFSVNIPTVEIMEAVKYCGRVSGRDVEDKFRGSGLTPVKPSKISSLLIKECPVNLECKLVKTLDVGGSHVWFIGEIVTSHKKKGYNRSHAILFWPGEYRYVGDVIKK